MFKRSWVEIDLNRIVDNYKAYKKAVNKDVMAVVKADAYGHGDTEVAGVLQSSGCSNFAVSNLNEAIRLRESGLTGQILILGFTPVACADDLLKYDITQALVSEEYAEALADKKIKAQFAIDTGMNRIGLDGDDPEACERVIRQYKDRFELTGLFTHLCTADVEAGRDFTCGQIEKFNAVSERISDLKLPFIHCLNSAGGLWHGGHGDLVRLGIIMYGLKPDDSNELPEEIKPALQWRSVIAMIKTVHSGETIGYGRTFCADHDMTVATIPTGYADGYRRDLSNCGCVFINGQKAPIVGRVCMDQLMVDISDIPDVKLEDEVSLLCDEYNADDMARQIGTIGYEIVCGISKRVPRIYIGK